MPVLPGISTKMLLQSWKWKSDAKHPSHVPTQKPSKTPTAYLVTLTVSLAYWIFSHHAAYGALSSAPSSTCMGSPPPSTYLEGLSMDGFSCLQRTLLSLIESLSKLPQPPLPKCPTMCLVGCGVGFLANVLVHALTEHMLVLLDSSDHHKGVTRQQAQDAM